MPPAALTAAAVLELACCSFSVTAYIGRSTEYIGTYVLLRRYVLYSGFRTPKRRTSSTHRACPPGKSSGDRHIAFSFVFGPTRRCWFN